MTNNQRGGGNGQQQMRENEAISMRDKLQEVLRTLEERGDELKGVLPRDVSLDGFLANINQALRNNPKLLNCTFTSIIDACVKAAYDGLRIDGKEAAIVDANERYKDGTVWRDRIVARYMPMAQGLIKQILKTGAALTVKAVVAYSNEARTGRFKVVEGTNPHIHHEPFVEGEDKGAMIGAYAIAEVKRGVFKFEWMDMAAILDVKKESKTDKVWERWPTEMWKKTVIRRLRKSLSGTAEIPDMEAMAMFPQFDRSTPHPQMGHNQQSPMPPRPTRDQRALPDQSGTENGMDMDFGRDDREVVEQGRREPQQEQQQRRQDAGRDDRQQQAQQEPKVELPSDDREWGIWGLEIERKVAEAKSTEEVDAVWGEAQPIAKHATKAIRSRLQTLVNDRNTAFALGEDDDAGAGAGGDD